MIRTAFLLALLSVSAPEFPAQQLAIAVKEAIAPHYPPIAVAARITGDVVVEVEIGADGIVQTASVVSGPEMLRVSAVQAAKRWKFVAESVTNRATKLKFSFGLLSEDDPDTDQTVFLPPTAIVIRHRPAKPTVNY